MDMRSNEAESIRQDLEEAVTRFADHGHNTRLARKLLHAREWGLVFQEIFFMNRRAPDVLNRNRYQRMEDAFAPILDIAALEKRLEVPNTASKATS